jgi:hypothetical protein
MSAGETEFLIDQGSTFQAEVVWQDANNAAINITHYDARMDVRYAQTKNADLVIQLNSSNSRISKGSVTGGKFNLFISAADTADLLPGTYFYDFEVFSTDSTSPVFVQRLIQGQFTVSPEVTG